MSSYTVTTSPGKVFDSPTGKKWILYNTGSVTAYAHKYPMSSVSEGFPLAPGSSLHWHEYDPLYLFTASGSTTVVVDNAVLDVFDPSTLAQLIATDLTGGSTLTNQGIATSIYNQGVVAANVVTKTNYTIPTIAVGAVGTAQLYDCLISQSYQIYFSTTPATSSALDASEVDIILEWFADAAYTQRIDARYYFSFSQASEMVLRGPCISRYLKVTVENNNAPTYAISSGLFSFSLYSVPLVPFIHRSQNRGALIDASGVMTGDGSLQGAQTITFGFTLAASTSYTLSPCLTVGPAVFSMALFSALVGAAGSLRFSLVSIGRLGRHMNYIFPPLSPAESFGNVDFLVPNEPCQIFVENRSTAVASIRGAITQPYPY